MTRRLSLQARLTIAVAAAFGLALSICSVLVVQIVENRLVADTRATATAVLSNHLSSITGGIPAVGVVGEESATQFFYLNAAGQELAEAEYFSVITDSFEDEFRSLFGDDAVTDDAFGGDVFSLPTTQTGTVTDIIVGGPGPSVSTIGLAADVTVNPDTGELTDSNGQPITVTGGPLPDGPPREVARGPQVVAVAQTLRLFDGSTLEVGVSSPLQPVTNSLDAVTDVLWFAVPSLIAMMALVAWHATGRALRPVDAIARRADEITENSLDQRVPLHPANDEIRHLGQTVNGMLDRLQRGQDRQRRLIADASHELRSPVAATRAQLEVAAANPQNTDWLATTRAVLAEQELLTHLIDDLLAMSKLDETGIGATMDVDLDDLLFREADRQPLPIELHMNQPVRISANPHLVTRVVRNLLDNAVRHADGDVAVTLTAHDGWALVHVDDNGPGIPMASRETIFERFARLDEARDRNSGGTGLGLAIAQQVAVAHRGTLTCGESPLGGTRMTLRLPVEPRRRTPPSARRPPWQRNAVG